MIYGMHELGICLRNYSNTTPLFVSFDLPCRVGRISSTAFCLRGEFRPLINLPLIGDVSLQENVKKAESSLDAPIFILTTNS